MFFFYEHIGSALYLELVINFSYISHIISHIIFLPLILINHYQIGGTDNQYQPEASSSQIPISITDDSNQQHFNTLHMNHSSEGSTKTTEEGNPHKKICMRK